MTIGELLSTGKQRFLNINLTTHMIGTAILVLGGAWQDAAFRSQVMEIFKSMPHWLQSVVTCSAMLYTTYKVVHKASTVSATVQPGQTGVAEVAAKAESK